jgi:hypothetical protein
VAAEDLMVAMVATDNRSDSDGSRNKSKQSALIPIARQPTGNMGEPLQFGSSGDCQVCLCKESANQSVGNGLHFLFGSTRGP